MVAESPDQKKKRRREWEACQAPRAAVNPDHAPFRPELGSEDRLEEMQRRAAAQQSVSKHEDYPDPDEAEYQSALARNGRVAEVRSKPRDLDAAGKILPKNFGPRVRVLRCRLRLSVARLARRAKIGKRTIYAIEAGESCPNLHTILAIASALNVPASRLIDGIG